MSQTVWFLLVVILLNALWCNLAYNKPQQLRVWPWFKHQHCLACCMLGSDREQTELFSWRKASMNLQFKKVRKKTLQQDEGHSPLVPYCINQRKTFVFIPFLSHWLHMSSFTTAPKEDSTIMNPQQHCKTEMQTTSEETQWHAQSAPTYKAQQNYLKRINQEYENWSET